MKIAIDSNELPAATRLDTWRSMLCDTYIGLDCHFPDDSFRSVIEGFAIGHHTITRITSSRHRVDRSPTLIRRDGVQVVFFGALLAGRATIHQGGRETTLERGAIVVSDTTRPFRTSIDAASDIVWIGVPKAPMVERVRNLEDLTATVIVPTLPMDNLSLGLISSLDDTLRDDVPAAKAEGLATDILDLLAMTIASDGLAPARSLHLMPRRPVQ